MGLKHLLGGLLAAGLLLGVAAQGQPAVDTTRVPQWYDQATGTTHYLSSQYPLPLRSPSMVHNTLTNIALTNGVAQVVIPAGSVVNGCDITFDNSYGDYFLAWTDPGAPTVPTATAPAGPGSLGRGLHLDFGTGYSTSQGYVYHCPGPSAQGVSLLYIPKSQGSATAIISMDVY